MRNRCVLAFGVATFILYLGSIMGKKKEVKMVG